MSTVFRVIAPRLLGPALIVAAALLVKGYTDVGDGFGGGAVAPPALALRSVVWGAAHPGRGLPVLRPAPAIAAGGLLVALAVGFLGLASGDPPFTHRPGPGEDVLTIGTLELITAVAFDLGLFLLVTASLVVLIHNLARLVAGPGA